MLHYLRCPKDDSHSSFRGIKQIQCEYQVELDKAVAAGAETLVRQVHDATGVVHHPIVCTECGTTAWPGQSSISFMPEAGTVLMCDLTFGFRPPEMNKFRPAIVISERTRNKQTCIVVPTSTKKPTDPDSPYVLLNKEKYPFLTESTWAKCEMVVTVRLGRLSRMIDQEERRGVDSRGTEIDAADLQSIRAGVEKAIGLA